MIERPKLKSFLTVFPVSGTTWGLRGGSDELWRVKLSDEKAMQAFGALLPYLDGRHTSEEILAALEGKGVPRAATTQLLQHLERSSLLEEADAAGLSAEQAEKYRDQITLFSRFTSSGGGRYQAALGKSRIGVVGEGNLGRSVRRQLLEAGFGEVVALCEDPAAAAENAADRLDDGRLKHHPLDRETLWPAVAGPQPSLLMVCEETHDPTLLETADGWSKKHRLPWLLLRAVDFQEGWVGPLFLPGETACYRSLDARLKGNMPFYEEHQAFDQRVQASGGARASLGGLMPVYDLLAAVAVTEAVKFVSEVIVPHLLGRFLTVNVWTWETEIHEVLRVPGIEPLAEGGPTAFPWKES